MNKYELRATLKKKRRSLTGEEQRRYASAIANRIEELALKVQTRSILFYFPVHSEVSLLSLARKMIADIICLFPRVEEKTLKPVRVSNIEKDFRSGFASIPEPTGEVYGGPVDLAVVPGLGFSRSKHRLGYGGGYYDRYLDRHEIISVGCFYGCLESDWIPDPHDRPLTYIATEREIF